MRNFECRNTRREIDESELHQALSESAAMHLQVCSGCRAFREERARLRDLVGSLDPVNAPPDFEFRLRARLAAQPERNHPPGLFRRFGMSLPATVAAALAVLLLGTIVLMNQRNRTKGPLVANTNEQSNQISSAPVSSSDQPTTATEASKNSPATDQLIATGPAPGTSRKSVKASQRGRSVRSDDFDEGIAPSIKGIDDGVAAPAKPVVVSMEDDRGATRTISLPPVSFGSQRLVDNRPVSQPGNRVW